MDHFIFNDISGAGDPLAFDGVHRTLDASEAEGPARITLTGFADDVTGSAYDDLIRMAGDVRTQMFDAWRGGFVRDTAEFDGYDLTVTGGDGADTFEFVAAPRASIGRFGYDTPGDVRITDFETTSTTARWPAGLATARRRPTTPRRSPRPSGCSSAPPGFPVR